ncbi:hypothetical protein CR513_02365, partial [Mucuna pruriens]
MERTSPLPEMVITQQQTWKTHQNTGLKKTFLAIVTVGIPQHADGVVVPDKEKKNLEELKLKDLKVKNYLFQVID